MLAVAALLVVAAVVVASQASRLGGPAPSALPADAPPSGVALMYTRDPANPHALRAYDWSGAPRGVARFPTWVPISRLRPSPDGSAFLLDPSTPGDYAAYFDRVGRTLFETNDDRFLSQAWADGGTHVCVQSGGALVTRVPGQADRAVPSQVGDGFNLAACSVRADVAIFASQDGIAIARLSTGAVLRSTSVPQGGSFVASADAAFVAIGQPGDEPVEIYQTGDLSRPAATLGSAGVPLAFSGDGSLLLAGNPGGEAPLTALEWRTGKVVWRYGAATGDVELVVSHQAAAEFALYIGTNAVVVRRDGTARKVA